MTNKFQPHRILYQLTENARKHIVKMLQLQQWRRAPPFYATSFSGNCQHYSQYYSSLMKATVLAENSRFFSIHVFLR